MNIRIWFLFILLVLGSCSKEEDTGLGSFSDYIDRSFINKILPDNDGYWLLTRSGNTRNCSTCNFTDGLTFFGNENAVSNQALGSILDAEIKNNTLIAVTSSGILSINRNLQATVIKNASSNEQFKLVDKDSRGNLWFLSNRFIFTLDGEFIAFPNNINALDFEISNDNSFWIAANDTVFYITRTMVKKFSLASITGSKKNISTINNLKIDARNNVWVNTSELLFKLEENTWKEVKTDNFVADNFKTIPFMDADANGRLWLAEKHYQAFTNLHCFDGNNWTSHKLEPPLEGWITDIEAAEPDHIWIGTTSGLRKMSLK